jgi:hypothetical protein
MQCVCAIHQEKKVGTKADRVIASYVKHVCTIQFVLCICLHVELEPFCHLVCLLHTNLFMYCCEPRTPCWFG